MSRLSIGGIERVAGWMNSEQLIDFSETFLLLTPDQVASQSGPSLANTMISQEESYSKHESTFTEILLPSHYVLNMNWPSQ